VTSTVSERRFRAEPYDYGEARAIAAELAVAEPVAVTLVRRGFRDAASARAFLDAAEAHDPSEFDGIAAACERILEVARSAGRITVHGDYDVDGVCATAVLVGCLSELGASCDWLIPDRRGDGYGLTEGSVAELRRRGTALAVTVDCGIGSAAEVELAREAGIETVVTDHHQPPERLPACPIVHPVVSGYPFEGLCGTGVAHKLALALRRAAGLEDDQGCDLDLVALATVADMVPLVGENRRLVREGLLAIRTRPRPGLRALMAVSRTDPETADESDLGFRLAPRINAAGRLYRADGGVELMLTEDADRAAAIATELDRANHERRAVEREALEGAERERSALPRELADAPALVLAGQGWHPGVVGIVASRMVERHWRPVFLLAREGEWARGSGRSIPGFDLVAALEACSEHLVRFGGHAMAAGLEIEADRIDAFREALVAHAEAAIEPSELVRTDRVDALVGVGEEGLGLDLADQLERLGPFGSGNPEPRLLVPAARIRDVRPLGEEGRHSRFELHSGAGRAQGVAFGVNGGLSAEEAPVDAAVRLELDRWNGAVSPRVVLRDVYEPAQGGGADASSAPGCGAEGCPGLGEGWWRRLEAELQREPGSLPEAVAEALEGSGGQRRELVDRRGGAIVAALAELVSSGASVLAICADASRRRGLAAHAADPRRFGGDAARIACIRCGERGLDSALEAVGDPVEPLPPGLALADWGALSQRPGAARAYEHVVSVDPPPRMELESLVRIARAGPGGTAPFAAGFLHLAWGVPELELAERCLSAEWELRPAIAEIWQALEKAGGGADADELAVLLAGPGRHSRPPEVAARCVRVLDELGLCEWSAADSRLAVVTAERTDLARSPTYTACLAEHQRRLRTLGGHRPELAQAA
jgi:single-stranded-DNA-specific exonuclease